MSHPGWREARCDGFLRFDPYTAESPHNAGTVMDALVYRPFIRFAFHIMLIVRPWTY